MLKVERCRRLLGKHGRELSDAEVERIRDSLYAVAGMMVDAFVEPGLGGRRPFERALELVPENESDAVAERAAIMEFDGNLPRIEAEKRAALHLVRSESQLAERPQRRAGRDRRGK